jgi:orotidine-5'-phosphate decarboxylase
VGVRERIVIALDTSDLSQAVEIAKATQPYVGTAKIGLQLFSAAGHTAVKAIQDTGIDVFLDVKLHDIPNTVLGASTVLGALGVRYLTVHAAGGVPMLEAAVRGLAEGAASAGLTPPTALAITVLTSDAEASAELLRERVTAAATAGCGGIVCAAPDLAAIRGVAPSLLRVVPGIRPQGAALNDQSRVATPRSAIENGASMLVIGRPITRAEDPAAAAEAIFNEVGNALDYSDA